MKTFLNSLYEISEMLTDNFMPNMILLLRTVLMSMTAETTQEEDNTALECLKKSLEPIYVSLMDNFDNSQIISQEEWETIIGKQIDDSSPTLSDAIRKKILKKYGETLKDKLNTSPGTFSCLPATSENLTHTSSMIAVSLETPADAVSPKGKATKRLKIDIDQTIEDDLSLARSDTTSSEISSYITFFNKEMEAGKTDVTYSLQEGLKNSIVKITIYDGYAYKRSGSEKKNMWKHRKEELQLTYNNEMNTQLTACLNKLKNLAFEDLRSRGEVSSKSSTNYSARF